MHSHHHLTTNKQLSNKYISTGKSSTTLFLICFFFSS